MLILVIFCQYIFVSIFNNVPFHFVELFLRGSYLKPEISKIISQNVFSLVPGDVLIDPHKVFELFVDIFPCRKMLTWPWSLCHRKISISCYIILQFIIIFICSIFSFSFFSTSLKDKVNLEFLLTIKK